MNNTGTLWGREPIAIVTAVMAVLAIIAVYLPGLNIVPDPDKLATALTLVLTLVAGGAVGRSQVSSPATVAKLVDMIPGGQASVDVKAALTP